ncbi:hypothetical protein AVEN_227791-1 [Araneus ventricosus]|uniref:Uncharacterized protein n=1 Tax=Araneus ventricosus TaxID=182803 RepID=A0A4Y2GN70_ARAVE|nr:hypothetical protein AVEN_227791-1 [Araneus ventricosus]
MEFTCCVAQRGVTLLRLECMPGHCILQLFITSKTLTAQKFFQLKMEITRSKVRAIGWMIKNFQSEMILQFLSLNAVTTWLNELAAEEYDMGILKLVNRCDKCLNVGGDYVEK